MKLLHRSTLIFLVLILLGACSVSPSEIAYGEDQCHACKMIISDKKFGAELVTTKGKVYKFDAIECLVPELHKNGENHYSYILVTDYNHPGKLINGKESFYLVSKNLPSPMGGNLSSFSSRTDVNLIQKQKSGDILNWEDLKLRYQ